MSVVIAWLVAHWAMIATVLLGISESLAVVFPSDTGAGGIIAAIIAFLKSMGAKDPSQS